MIIKTRSQTVKMWKLVELKKREKLSSVIRSISGRSWCKSSKILLSPEAMGVLSRNILFPHRRMDQDSSILHWSVAQQLVAILQDKELAFCAIRFYGTRNCKKSFRVVLSREKTKYYENYSLAESVSDSQKASSNAMVWLRFRVTSSDVFHSTFSLNDPIQLTIEQSELRINWTEAPRKNRGPKWTQKN